MLKKEEYGHDVKKFVIKKTWDFTPVVESVKELRTANTRDFAADKMHVGRIPMPLLGQWLKEAGVAWSDTAAMQEVIKKKLLSGEFNDLRVNEGTF